MRQRSIDSTPSSPEWTRGRVWVIAPLVVVAGMCIGAAWGRSAPAGGSTTQRSTASVGGEIARAHPGRDATQPPFPLIAITEPERLIEDVEPDGATTLSWLVSIAAIRCGTQATANRMAAAGAAGRAHSVDLLRLCRLLI